MIVCADDFGLSPAINKGILDLVEKGRITAVSCIVSAGASAAGIEQLRKLAGRMDVGLHFTLSNESLANDRKLPPFSRLARDAFLGHLSEEALRSAMRAQVEEFCDDFHDYPDFCDGHQHVHQLPIVASVFTNLVSEIAQKKRVYARASALPWHSLRPFFLRDPLMVLGASAISRLGFSLRALLKSQGIPVNNYLWGYHRYQTPGAFGQAFAAACSGQPGPSDVFFCHPGFKDPSANPCGDAMGRVRRENYTFLASDKVSQLLRETGTPLHRFFDR